jgi:hypothetical protein
VWATQIRKLHQRQGYAYLFLSAPKLDITEQIIEATLKVRKKSRALLLYERSFEHDWTVLA